MQFDEVRKLQLRFRESPFEHDHSWEKEYYLGSSTGDYFCSICGIDKDMVDDTESAKKKKKGKDS